MFVVKMPMAQKLWFLARLCSKLSSIVIAVGLADVGRAHSQEAPALVVGGTTTTKFGRAQVLDVKGGPVKFELEFDDGKDKLVTRCQNVRSLMKNSPDLTLLLNLVVPTKPRLRISVPGFLPEFDFLWNQLLTKIASDQVIVFEGLSKPYRPSIIEIGVELAIADATAPEVTLVQSDFKAFQDEAFSRREELRTSGQIRFDVTSAMLPCLVLEGRVTGSLSITAKSFDAVRTNRVMKESDVRSLVRKAEDQIMKDNNPPGFVNITNMRSFVSFRSVESIGGWVNWLEKEKIVYWERFIDEWVKRLGPVFRPLSEEELASVSLVLTSIQRDSTLFRYKSGQIAVK